MKVITRRFRFNKIWEMVMVDGQVMILVKDVLDYFGYSKSSQHTITNVISEDDKMILVGSATKDMKHAKGRAMVITVSGLMEFVHNKLQGDRKEKGKELIKWIKSTAIPEMKRLAEKEGVIDDPAPENAPNIFDMIQEQEINDLKKVVVLQSERIGKLENTVQKLEQMVRSERMERMVKKVDGKTMVDADTMINFLKGIGPDGNL